MGSAVAVIVAEPVKEMWRDMCIYCCDALEVESTCGCCRVSVVTHAHEEIDETDKG